jgi:DNA-binding response OmpR family regulator
MAAKILVVDDDPNVQRLLQYTLKQEGYEVVIAADGAEGFRMWGAEAPDLILLDVMLPKLDGYQVATKIRTEEGTAGHVPIIMLTAEREVEQKVRGLRAGADDYLIKPFAIVELTARLEALLRRHGAEGAGPHMAGDIVVDPRRHVATRDGRELGLTRREFDLLDVFVRHPGQVLSRDQLLSLVWGYTTDVETNVVDVFVGYLRRKLEGGGEPRILHTVRGVGWALRP